MYTLHFNPYSHPSRRVISLLEEAQLEYQLQLVELDKGEHLQAAYLSLNPSGQVPTLVDKSNDLVLTESNAILRYLCNKHHLWQWYPQDVALRAKVDQWLDWNQCMLAPNVVDIVLNTVFMGDKGDKQAIARGKEKLAQRLPLLEKALHQKEYLVGDTPTIADLCLASTMFQLGFADIVADTPNIVRWCANVFELKGFKASLPKQ